MAYNRIIREAYGIGGMIEVFPTPIKATKAPVSTQKVELGQLYVDESASAAYIMVNRTAGTWLNVGGAAGSFASLTVTPGPTAITGAFTVTSGTENVSIGADAADHDVTIGSTTGASPLSLRFGTGGATLAGAVTGNITIGSAASTAEIKLGISTAGGDVDIAGADNTASQLISIASGDSAADTDVDILGGDSTAGTQTLDIFDGTNTSTGLAFNLMNGGGTGTRSIKIAGDVALATTIGIGDGLLGNTITIGNGINSVAQSVSIANGASAANSTVNILSGVGTAGAGVLNLANNPRVTTVDIGDVAPAASRTITVGGGTVVTAAVTDTIDIGVDGATTNVDSVKNVNIGTGAVDIGSSTVAIGSSALTTSGSVILNLGTGTAAAGTHTVNIGTGTGGGTKSVNIGNADGLTDIVLRSPIESSAGAAHTLNASMGAITCTGLTTAAAADETITITNSEVSAASGIIVGVGVVGAEDARMELQKVRPGAGSFTVLLKNTGGDALASNLIISFIVLS